VESGAGKGEVEGVAGLGLHLFEEGDGPVEVLSAELLECLCVFFVGEELGEEEEEEAEVVGGFIRRRGFGAIAAEPVEGGVVGGAHQAGFGVVSGLPGRTGGAIRGKKQARIFDFRGFGSALGEEDFVTEGGEGGIRITGVIRGSEAAGVGDQEGLAQQGCLPGQELALVHGTDHSGWIFTTASMMQEEPP
jgi:hypothetical protein